MHNKLQRKWSRVFIIKTFKNCHITKIDLEDKLIKIRFNIRSDQNQIRSIENIHKNIIRWANIDNRDVVRH